MFEADTNKGVPPWLREELARHLSPVSAPENLWSQFKEQTHPQQRHPLHWPLWVAVTVMLFMASGSWIWHIYATNDPISPTRVLALQELRAFLAEPEMLHFHSEDPGKVQSWIKTNTNLNLSLTLDQLLARNGTVHLCGVRKISLRGEPVAAIAYRVGGEAAILLISKAQFTLASASPSSQHHFFPSRPKADVSLVSWSTANQIYTVAFSGIKDPQRACLLCHTEGGEGRKAIL